MEKIRELISLLESGVEEYDAQMKVLQSERLKYIRLSITDGFGTEEGDSKESWLLHPQATRRFTRTETADHTTGNRGNSRNDIQKEENA